MSITNEVLTISDARSLDGILLTSSRMKEIIAGQNDSGFIVKGIVDPFSTALVAGDSGLGKSPLLYQMGLCVAAGIPFLDFETTKGRVIYCDLENGIRAADKLADTLTNTLGLHKRPDDFRIYAEGYSDESDVTRMVEEFSPSLCIIDSLRMNDSQAVEKNSAMTEYLKSLRHLARNHGTSFVIVHHLRKPGKEGQVSLEDTEVNEWLNYASGPRALVNHSDCRIGIDYPGKMSRNNAALVLKGFTRIEGTFGPIYVTRILDSDGTPIGYRRAVGIDLLSPEHADVFRRLPQEFTFKDARLCLGRSEHPTNAFLKRCESLKLIVKAGHGRYIKLTV